MQFWYPNAFADIHRWWVGKPKECSQNEGEGTVDDSMGKPCDDVKNGVCEACEDVADVCSVQYQFEHKQKDYMHGRSMVCR